MPRVSDEQLMAFADGMLEPAEAARVEAAIAADPTLERRLHVFRLTGDGLKPFYDGILDEPVPQRLIDAVHRHAPAAREVLGRGTPRGGAVGLLHRADDRRRTSWTPLDILEWLTGGPRVAGAGLAFASAIAIAAAGGWLAHDLISRPNGIAEGGARFAVSSAGQPIAAGDLAEVLETETGGARVAVSDGEDAGAITPVLTFISRAGAVCRQFTISAPHVVEDGVACRDGADWRIVARIETTGAKAGAGDGAIAPAAGAESPVEAYVSALIAGDVLGADEEKVLRGNGWHVPSH